MCLRCCCLVCALCLCSLRFNSIGAAGAAAIGAGLVYVPQLRTLMYVVWPAECARPWCVFARECGAMACVCAGGVVCAPIVCAALQATFFVPRVRRPLVQAWSMCPSCRHWSTLCAQLCVLGGGVCLHESVGWWHVLELEMLCVWLVFVQPWQEQYRCRGCGGHRCGPGPRASAADTGVRCVSGCVFGAVVCACAGTRADDMCSRWSCWCVRLVFEQPSHQRHR
jgi:hypothetical protein